MNAEDAVLEVTAKIRGFKVGDVVTLKHWFELDKETKKETRTYREQIVHLLGGFGVITDITPEEFPVYVAFDTYLGDDVTEPFLREELWLLDWE